MQASKIKIENGHIVDPYQGLDGIGDIFIEDGKIIAVHLKSNKQKAPFVADQTIDANKHLVCPSLVDLSTQLREPGYEQKATLASELKAAVSAGIGHLACLPTCSPTINNTAIATSIIDAANKLELAKLYPIGALTIDLAGENLSEMKALNDVGCPAMTNYYNDVKNLNVFRRCYEYAATFNIPVFIFPQLPELANEGCAHEGPWATKLGLPSIPETAETIALANQLLLIEQTGVTAHFSQLSSARAIDMINAARKSGLQVSCDVAAHQLFLDESCLQDYDGLFHLQPPLRSNKDMLALRDALSKGSINAICSSHQPHELAAKQMPFQSTEPGISALETLLPLSAQLVSESFSWMDLVKAISKTPADILGIQREGICEGSLADLCIISLEKEWILKEDEMLSAGKNTPFISERFQQQNQHTFIEGQLVFSR